MVMMMMRIEMMMIDDENYDFFWSHNLDHFLLHTDNKCLR